MKKEDIKKTVRENYGAIARQGGKPTASPCCCGPVSNCCGGSQVDETARSLGYTDADLNAVPEGANLGLGCGNPVALASLKEGETVLDLGSGAGFDCFLAAQRVGKKGKVIGVDMTPDMLDRARANARKNRTPNVEFRLGEIENLPVADNTIDAIISNCVINLSPEKDRVFQEANRVLKQGGRLMVSDIVLTKALPEAILKSVSAYISCVAGASLKEDYLKAIKKAGFKDIKIVEESTFPIEGFENDPTVREVLKLVPGESLKDLAKTVTSIKVQAFKS